MLILELIPVIALATLAGLIAAAVALSSVDVPPVVWGFFWLTGIGCCAAMLPCGLGWIAHGDRKFGCTMLFVRLAGAFFLLWFAGQMIGHVDSGCDPHCDRNNFLGVVIGLPALAIMFIGPIVSAIGLGVVMWRERGSMSERLP